MSINLPGEWGIVDLRDPIVGDSFSWAGVEPAPAKKVIVIHATASQAPNEDGFTMANYHVNNNGWGGIGVHFVVTKDNYPGYPGHTNPGAQVQYVGDLLTWRAGVANNNPGRVHIEISGLFTPGNGVPSESQLRLTRRLIDNLLAPNNILPSLNYYSQVDYHNHQATPGNGTACPGWQHPQFGEWFGYLQGGPEPSWWHPAPTPAPEPVPVVVTPPADTRPEWEKTWNPTPISDKVVAVPSADVYDFVAGKVSKTLPGGEPVQKLAGSFTVNGQEYVRTQWSVDNNKWNGILHSELKDVLEPEVVNPPAPNPANPVDSIQPPVSMPTDVLDTLENPPVVVPVQDSPEEVGKALTALWQLLLGILMSPLRLIGRINKFLGGLK